jgi:SAM-dependent methyltransferase
LLAALGVRAGERVADVGAGGGYLTLHLSRAVGPSGRVVATDIDEEALALLRRRAAGLPWVEARRADAGVDGGGLEKGSYDLIVLAQVDHLLPEDRRGAALRGLFAALRPGGRLALANAERHRAGTDRALRAAGLSGRTREVDAGLPGQYVLVVE